MSATGLRVEQTCVVEARDVVLSFGQTPALRGASVSVAAGEILAVMGPSGSGKSTLLHCLAGILVPGSGEVHFAGRRVDIALPLLLGGTRRAEALKEARAWFERLDLDGLEQRRSGELSGGQGPARRVQPSSCDGCQADTRAAALDPILSVVAGALLFPLLVFIGTATRLAAARQEQRLAAIRLVGATPRQVSMIAMVEATISAGAGTALGFGLFFLLRNPVAAIPFTGAPFFPEDLSLNLANVLLVAIGVPAAAAVAARLACRPAARQAGATIDRVHSR